MTKKKGDREKMPKPQKPPKKLPNELLFGQLKPLQKKQINIRLFGVDPAYSTGTAQETHVLVRKHQRAHTTMPEIHISRSSNEHDENEDLEDPEEDQQLLERKDSVLSAPAGVGRSTRRTPSSTRTHDLIPYTGRLLTATVEFIYIADIQTENGESYERSERLSLAISIVPALTIIDWQIIAGDSSSTRFVVVDVKNLTTAEAELTFGADQRMISVQPKDLCRVPLLCPCSAEIHASDFQQAAQRASHLMQMQEIDQLRRKLEKHISTHLEIRWKIGALELEGLIPFGPLLASVSFLKQLVVPSISVCKSLKGCGITQNCLSSAVHVNDKPYLNEADIISGVGEMQRMKLKISCVASSSASSFGFPSNSNQMPVVFKGEIALHCFQDLQNGKAPIDRMENLVVCGVQKRPFNLKLNNETDQKSLQTDKSSSLNVFTTSYTFLFRTEGIYKLRPNVQAWRGQTPIQADELFVPTVSFNVVTKLGSSSSLSSNNRQSMVSIKDSPG
ncbi:hypothetical protein M3Y97_00156900 [Aphelenchoides bicaudatus]|nr:hypothetical protein M3Y97_00156900 [Aphelenchoides bicaudatus]